MSSTEFFSTIYPNVESLCAAADPDATPYASKYAARALLDSFISSAESAAAGLDGAERAALCDALAVAHAQAGAAAVATDETGVGEAHLTTALPWLASRFEVSRAAATWRPTVPMTSVALGVHPPSSHLSQSAASSAEADAADGAAALPLQHAVRLATAALTAASQLALVYSGWDNHARALRVLRVAKRVHRAARGAVTDATATERVGAAAGVLALDDAYTHLVFYFAQVYGHLGCPAIAARYVERTLTRQLAADERGRDRERGASLDRLEWARNALRLSEAHAVGARPNVAAAALCLAAADLMLGHVAAEAGGARAAADAPAVAAAVAGAGGATGEAADLLREPPATPPPLPPRAEGDAAEAAQRARTAAESALHWALLFESILRTAADRRTERDTDPTDAGGAAAVAGAVDDGAPAAAAADPFSTVVPVVFAAHAGGGSTRGEGADAVDVNDSDHDADGAAAGGDAGVPSPLVAFLQRERGAAVRAAVRSFAPARVGPAAHPGGVLLSGLATLPAADAVHDFPHARALFLAAVAAFEAAAAHFVLDGFVTEFRVITEGHARAYKSLAAFEPDAARRAAMHRRRAKLLDGLAFQLNPAVYAAPVKELSFAAGCAWMDACESFATLIASEKATKDVNSTVDSAVASFSLFLRGFNVAKLHFKGAPQPPFANATTAVDADMAEPFALAHFYCARLLFRRSAPSKVDRVRDALASLERFQHFLELCTVVGAHDKAFLKPQVELAVEVISLLPQKARLLMLEA
jgi:hypothetical protein